MIAGDFRSPAREKHPRLGRLAARPAVIEPSTGERLPPRCSLVSERRGNACETKGTMP